MTIDDLKEHFGSVYKACLEAGIYPQSITRWRKIGKIPLINQLKFEQITNGALKADFVKTPMTISYKRGSDDK